MGPAKLIPSFVNCAAGEEFGTLMLVYLGIMFLFIHCLLKQISELHFSNFSLYVLEFLDEKSLAG
jgi:hypothetical protein